MRIKLEVPLNFSFTTQPICLSKRTPAINEKTIIAGWGDTSNGHSIKKSKKKIVVYVDGKGDL